MPDAVTGTTESLPTVDGPMDCYVVEPPDEPRGGVIVIQEAFGVNAYVEDVTRRFAAVGYVGVAPHLFHRSGGGTAPYDDFAKVIPLFEGLTDEGILMDVDAARDRVRSAGVADDQTGIVGFCFGGRVSFLIALERTLGAAVGFYGGGIVTQRFPQFPALVERIADLKTPWLGLFGDADESIPVDDVERLRSELERAPVSTDVICYPDARHGFHCDIRDSYDEQAAKDAWARSLAWFDHHLAVQTS